MPYYRDPNDSDRGRYHYPVKRRQRHRDKQQHVLGNSKEQNMKNIASGAAWIVDGAYANLGARSNLMTVDFVQLKRLLELQYAEGRIQESYFINAITGEVPEPTRRFYKFIQSAEPEGPQMRVELYGHKRLVHKCSCCSTKSEKLVQKGVDVAIATRMLETANRCKQIFLFLGDSDFAESIRSIKNHAGKEVIIMGFRGSVSAEIQCLADRVIWLNDIASQVQRQVA